MEHIFASNYDGLRTKFYQCRYNKMRRNNHVTSWMLVFALSIYKPGNAKTLIPN